MGKGFDNRYLFTDIKNNGNFWTLTRVLLLIAVWYYAYKIEREKNNAIDKYLKKTVAYTTTCNRNIRAPWTTLNISSFITVRSMLEVIGLISQ